VTAVSALAPARPRRDLLVRVGPPRRLRWALGPLVLCAACAAGAIAAFQPLLALAACALVLLCALVWVRPATAAYLLIGATPLVAGIDRGVAIPFFRPNEALLLVLGGTLALKWLVGLRAGGFRLHRPDVVETAILLLAVTNSVTPLVAMAVRRQEITMDDLLYSLVLWKLVGLYFIVRASVRRPSELRTCLLVSVASACLVAVIGILQGLDLLGVRVILGRFYAQFGAAALVTDIPRGGSTLSLPAATADLMILNLAVVAALWMRERRHTAVAGATVALLVMGCLAAGEFSSTIGLVVAMLAIPLVTGSGALLAVFAALLVGGLAALWPVIAVRLGEFAHASGVPPSWVGRQYNLSTYFWPELTAHHNWLLGVRPSARVPVSSQITGYVWIESGYLWLFWGGGIPLMLAFVMFVWVAGRQGWRIARRRPDAVGAAGAGVFVAIVVMTLLMVFDPHVTYRGSADALFALLALTAGTVRRRFPSTADRHVKYRATGAGSVRS
jgi:hypothetical protein